MMIYDDDDDDDEVKMKYKILRGYFLGGGIYELSHC